MPEGSSAQREPVGSARPAVVRDAGLIMVAEFFRKGVLYLAFIIVARSLGVEGFGEFSALLGLGAILAVVVDFGLAELTVRELARRPDSAEAYLRRSRRLKLLLTGIVVLALPLLAFVLDESLLALGVATAYYVAASFGQINVSYFRAHHRMDLEVTSRAIEFGLLLMLVVAAARWHLSVLQTLGLFVLASASGLLVSHALLRRVERGGRTSVDAPDIRSIVKAALPFALSLALFLSYYRLNVVLLEKIAGESAAGLFNASYQLVLGVMVLPIAVSAASFPTLSKLDGAPFKRLLLARAALLFGAGVLVAIVAWTTAPWTIRILYGSAYAGAAVSLQILSLALPVMFLTALLAIGLQSQNRARVVSYVAAANFITALGLNLLLIPRFGATGTASALLVTECLSAAWMGIAIWLLARKPRPAPGIQEGAAEGVSVSSQ